MTEARGKAGKLLAELLRQQGELEANPPKLDASKLAEGRAALSRAVAAAQRVVESLDEAIEVARASSP